MAEDASPPADRSSSRRKRKAQDHPDGGDAASSVRGRSVEPLASEPAAILRAAIEFRDRTGLAPTKSTMGAFYDSVKDSLPPSLSQGQIYNKIRHIRHKANHADAEDIVLELAAQLWPESVNVGKKDEESLKKAKNLKLDAHEEDRSVKKEKKAEKNYKSEKKPEDRSGQKEVDEGSEKGKNEKSTVEQKLVDPEKEEKEIKAEKENEGKNDKNGEERGIKPEQFPYLTASIAKHWEFNGLTKASLEIGMKSIDPARAKVLEEKWSKLLEDEMKFHMSLVSTRKELWAMLVATHKGTSIHQKSTFAITCSNYDS